jgi:hypothetical protein
MPSADPRATGAASLATTAIDVVCVGPPPQRGALRRLGEHGVRWLAAPATAGAAPQLVVATAPPGDAVASAARQAQRQGLPFVLDLDGAWALDGSTCHPTPWHLRQQRRAMQRALTAADLVLVRTPTMATACVELGAVAGKVVIVPDGCDAAAELGPAPGDTFTLLVAAELAPAIDPPCPTSDGLLRRRARQIEPVGATGFYLFSALAALRQKVPDVFARLRVHFAHPLDRTNLDIVDWLALEAVVAPQGGVAAAPRATAADAVFVCQHGEDGDAQALDVPDALWPALATGRPVLAALPPGPGRDLVLHLGAGPKLPATDAPPLVLAIERLVGRKTAGEALAGVAADVRARLDERRIAAAVAAMLVAVAARAPLPAGAQALWPVVVPIGGTGSQGS